MRRTLEPTTVQRLAFVRYLYFEGKRQSDQAEPFSSTAILSFHDAVELFLGLAVEHLAVSVPANVNFADYWGKLEPKLGQELPSKSAMVRLNKSRVGLKHHGTLPSMDSIQQAVADVTTFLVDGTRLVFDVEFESVDMSDLITFDETRTLLKQAQIVFERGDHLDAVAVVKYAFDRLMHHYAESVGFWDRNSPGFGATLPMWRGGRPREEELRRLYDVYGAGRLMQEALRVLALGIDFQAFTRFSLIAPSVWGMTGDVLAYGAGSVNANPSSEDYEFCRRFVIESAVRAVRSDCVVQARKEFAEKRANVGQSGGWVGRVKLTGLGEDGAESS